MKKAVGLFLSTALLVGSIMGCAAPAAPAPAPAPAPEAKAKAEAPAAEIEAEKPEAPEDTAVAPGLSGKKIGVTFYDLTNPIWAATGENIVKFGKELGAEVTLVSCEGNAATQVSQVENMISAGMDLIVIGPQDANALGSVVATAKEKGILTMAYGQSMQNVDSQYVVENYEAGLIVGQQAGKWINEKLGGKAKVGMLDYPLMEDIIFRANGIIDGMKEVCPGAEIVATATSADPVTGMAAVETFLQANPDMKVITCIGDGGAVGANEAIKASGKVADDVGIFSCDGTAEALFAMKSGDPIRMTVGLGTPTQKAMQVVELAARMLQGQPYEKSEFTPMDPVDISNVEQYWIDAGY